MDERASRRDPEWAELTPPAGIPVRVGESVWNQLSLLGPSAVIIDPRLIVDGPNGTIDCSVMITEFWSGDLIALESWPAKRFPDDLQDCLEWLASRVQALVLDISPF